MTTLIDAQANLRTLRDVLRYAVTRFNEAQLSFGHGQADAFEEAAFIVMRTLKLPTERLEFFADAYLTHAEIHELLQVIDRRVKKRLPAAYLLNEAWLRGYKFYVDERVIVPRSFIGELLDEGLSPWVQDRAAVTEVLDMCTGSGCLAIMAADVFPNAKVDAADTSADALQVAREVGLTVREKNFSLTDVYGADEAFVTGTFAGLVPVRQVDGRTIGQIAPLIGEPPGGSQATSQPTAPATPAAAGRRR